MITTIIFLSIAGLLCLTGIFVAFSKPACDIPECSDSTFTQVTKLLHLAPKDIRRKHLGGGRVSYAFTDPRTGVSYVFTKDYGASR